MTFAGLWLLWMILPLFAAWAAAWGLLPWWRKKQGKRDTAALRFSSLSLARRLPVPLTVRLRRGVEGLRVLTVVLLLLAILRPQTGRRESKQWSQGVDILLTLDTSPSMQALDLDSDLPITKRRTRLQVVKDVVQTFVQKREADPVGMVVFGAEAFTQCPLTLDHGIVTTLLQQVQPGMAGDSTAIGSGLLVAVNRLKKSEAKSKVIVLLTDGSNNAGPVTPKKAAEVAKAFGIKVYTIGAGSRDKAPFIVDTVFGKQVDYMEVDIDEPTLQEIAKTTGGAYFRADNTRALVSIYDQIDKLEKTEIQKKTYVDYDERFAGLVWAAMGLLLAEVLLLGTRFRKIP